MEWCTLASPTSRGRHRSPTPRRRARSRSRTLSVLIACEYRSCLKSRVCGSHGHGCSGGHPLLQAHHRSASALSVGASHLRLVRVVIDHTKTVSGYEAADRAGAVNGKGQRPVPPDDEAGRLQEAPLLLEECAPDSGKVHAVVGAAPNLKSLVFRQKDAVGYFDGEPDAG